MNKFIVIYNAWNIEFEKLELFKEFMDLKKIPCEIKDKTFKCIAERDKVENFINNIVYNFFNPNGYIRYIFDGKYNLELPLTVTNIYDISNLEHYIAEIMPVIPGFEDNIINLKLYNTDGVYGFAKFNKEESGIDGIFILSNLLYDRCKEYGAHNDINTCICTRKKEDICI